MKKITIYSKVDCGYCVMAKNLAEQKGHDVRYLTMGEDYSPQELMETFPGARTFPQIIVDGEKIGGYSALVEILTDEV